MRTEIIHCYCLWKTSSRDILMTKSFFSFIQLANCICYLLAKIRYGTAIGESHFKLQNFNCFFLVQLQSLFIFSYTL